MNNQLQVQLLSNTGVFLQYGNSGILIDVFNGNFPPFKELSDSLFQDILNKKGIFAGI